MVSTAWRKDSTSNWPAGSTNFIRFSEARLHAESSANMYSEQGFDALIRMVALQGFQRFTVVSNCMPGSPHWWVASAIWRIRSRARYFFTGWPSTTLLVYQSRPSETASMNASVARTELLAFWKKTELYASPSSDES